MNARRCDGDTALKGTLNVLRIYKDDDGDGGSCKEDTTILKKVSKYFKMKYQIYFPTIIARLTVLFY